MVNRSFSAILGGERGGWGEPIAIGTQAAAAVLWRPRYDGPRAGLPAAVDIAGDVEGAGLNHVGLPSVAAGARRVSQSSVPERNADDSRNMGSCGPNGQLFAPARAGPSKLAAAHQH